jgi:Glycosyltransferases, probably involved in cell wall biogenesis
MQEKAVSIIIPCYNVERYLSRCVSSLLSQTIGLENLELIFVDDASTDGTLDHLYQLEQQYPEEVMVVTYPENQGLGAARNIGMGYATGKYVGFVDSDDWVHPRMYKEMYEKAEETGCELVSSYPYQTSDEKEEAPGRIQDESCDRLYHIQNDAQRRELLAAGMSIFGTVNVWSKLYRRDLIEENDLRFGERYAFEDLYFSDMAAFYINRFCVMQAQYYNYYIHPGSIVTTMDCESWYEQRTIMQVWLQECMDRGLTEVYPDEIELIFGRDYYVSNLHYVFTRGRGDEDGIVYKTQMVTKALFPDIEKNPYILRDGEAHIRNCQKKLFAYVSKGFAPGEIWRVRKDYLKDALELVHKERAEKIKI